MRKLDVCDMEELGRLESSERTIAILGDRWWPQIAEVGRGLDMQFFHVAYGRRVMNAQMLEVFILGVGTVHRLERGAWSLVQ